MLDIADLPQPSEAFDWVQAAAGPALFCRPLAALAPHLFTTRHWRLGSGAADGDTRPGWDDVARTLDVEVTRLVRVRQVHGNAVLIAGQPAPNRIVEADVIISANSDLALAVQAADCVPLLVADRRSGAVAAAHAGWRGLAAGVPRAVVDALTRECGSRPADLVIAIGPAIGACCYEVGEDVRERFASTFNRDQVAGWFADAPAVLAGNPSMPRITGARTGRWFFDGWKAAREQLVDAGVPTDQIFAAALCTASHPEALCSYRRDGPPAGRMAAVIRSAPRRP
jgi:YfiH family protein